MDFRKSLLSLARRSTLLRHFGLQLKFVEFMAKGFCLPEVAISSVQDVNPIVPDQHFIRAYLVAAARACAREKKDSDSDQSTEKRRKWGDFEIIHLKIWVYFSGVSLFWEPVGFVI